MASVEQPTAAPPKTGGLLLNPRTYDPADLDSESRRVLLATIEWFESRGKRKLKDDDHERVWYSDFLEFVEKERIFATFLTPGEQAAGVRKFAKMRSRRTNSRKSEYQTRSWSSSLSLRLPRDSNHSIVASSALRVGSSNSAAS